MTLRKPLVFDSAKSLAAELPAGDLIDFSNVDNSPFAGYIDGLKMVWVSGTALTVTSGSAYVPSLGKVLRATSDIAKTSLSLTPSAGYYVYLYDNAGIPDIELSTTVPAAPYSGAARTKTGDTSRRYVGSVETNASGGLLKFTHSAGFIGYLEGLSGAPLSLVSNGMATTETTFSVAGAVPITATDIQLQFENAASSGVLYVRNPSTTSALPGGYLADNYPLTIGIVRIPLDSSFNLSYMYGSSPSGGGAYLRACGYFFER